MEEDLDVTDEQLDAELAAEEGAEAPDAVTDEQAAGASPEEAIELIRQVEADIAATAERLKAPRPTVQNHLIDTMDPASIARRAELVQAVKDAGKKGRKGQKRRDKRDAEQDLRKWDKANLGRKRARTRALRKARRRWERDRKRNRNRASRHAKKLATLRIRALRKATGGGFNATIGAVGGAVGDILGGLTNSGAVATAGSELPPELAYDAGLGDPSTEADIMAGVPDPSAEPLGRLLPMPILGLAAAAVALLVFTR